MDPFCSYSIGNLAELMRCIPPNVSVFGIQAFRELFVHDMTDPDDDCLSIFERVSNHEKIFEMVRCYDQSRKSLCLSLSVDTSDIELSYFMYKSLRRLFLLGGPLRPVVCCKNIIFCPFLKDLLLINIDIDYDMLNALTSAVKNGKLPSLTHLSLKGAKSSITGKISMLFQCDWPTLTTLDLNHCFLDESDAKALSSCGQKQTPKLASVTLCFGDQEDERWGSTSQPIPFAASFRLKWYRPSDLLCEVLFCKNNETMTNIKVLVLHEINKEEYQCISAAVNSGRLPRLSQLSLAMWKFAEIHKSTQIPLEVQVYEGISFIVFEPRQQTERLNPLDCPTLTDLTLHRFICSPSHLLTVAISAKRSNIRKLDISHSSRISGKLFILFGHSFPVLHALIANDCGLNSRNFCSLAKAYDKKRLPKLKHLDLSDNPGLVDEVKYFPSKWRNLDSFAISIPKSSESHQDLVGVIRTGAFENVQHLHLNTGSPQSLSVITEVKWPLLQRLEVTSSTSSWDDQAAILQTILVARENNLVANLKELFLNLREFHAKSSVSLANVVPNSPHLLSSPSTESTYSMFIHQMNTVRSLFPASESFDHFFNLLFRRLESKPFNPLGMSDSLREIVQDIPGFPVSYLNVLQSFADETDIFLAKEREDSNELFQLISKFYAELRTVAPKNKEATELLDGTEDLLRRIEWPHEINDVKKYNESVSRLILIRHELGKYGICIYIVRS